MTEPEKLFEDFRSLERIKQSAKEARGYVGGNLKDETLGNIRRSIGALPTLMVESLFEALKPSQAKRMSLLVLSISDQ